jgi:hypothetical protein
MKFFDALLGRRKHRPPDLDALFGLPAAALTLEASLGLRPAGAGAVCFKPASGAAFAETAGEVTEMLSLAAKEQGTEVTTTTDSYGYAWVVVRGGELADRVTSVHMVTTTLAERGFSPQLLASVFPFNGTDGRALHLVYLIKRGTFYPFAPKGSQQRDTALELSVRSAIEGEIEIETDLSRWFPIWGVPIP